jgi:hypothetical protein
MSWDSASSQWPRQIALVPEVKLLTLFQVHHCDV